MEQVIIRKKKEAALARRHSWVFSGAVKEVPDGVEDGDTVAVQGESGRYLGMGHFQRGSIMVRMISFDQQAADLQFWAQKIQKAYDCRLALGLANRADLNAYRLVHAEGDGLPGLIIDIYGSVAVVQCHSIGMHRSIALIAEALQAVLGPRLSAIYDKSAATLPQQYAGGVENGYCYGQGQPLEILEYGHRFWVDWESGQKTGFFLDQRDNRQLLGTYAGGKKVLNAYCYTGGFSVYALQSGAQRVDSVDVSKTAIALAERNVALGGFETGSHKAYAEDVMEFLKAVPAHDYDIAVVDPPAFAKNIKKRHNAVQGYKRLNALAMQKVKTGGLLFTFSCSQVVDRPLFNNTIVAAAHEAGRDARILHQLSQPADHPVGIFHPEGEYLKGLVLYLG